MVFEILFGQNATFLVMFQRIYKKETRIKCNREYVLWVVGSRFWKFSPG